jgi:GTP-binding protein
LEARAGVDHLSALAHRKFWKAGDGKRGSGANKQGRSGRDLRLHVPPGTTVRDADEGLLLKDLVQPGDHFIVARGGKGGYGNLHFKSSTNRSPRESTPGGRGERRRVVLELKVIADVGLVGKPNAGKSTLLSRVSHARPEIAAYPFTTKHPHLGRVQIDADRSFVMADIPGLIEGAHRGVGLGHEFLRHVERAGVLVHLVEPAPLDGTIPMDNYHAIRDELIHYNPQLGQRPEIVVVSKGELPGAAEIQSLLAQETGKQVLLISAVTGLGLNQLIGQIAAQLKPSDPR